MKTVILATIAPSGTKSNVVDLKQNTVVALITPPNLVGTALSFNAGFSQDELLPLYDKSGNAYSITTAKDRFVFLARDNFEGIRFMQVISGSTETNGAAIKLVVK